MELSGLTRRLTRLVRDGAGSLVGLVYPQLCEVCGTALIDGEETMCLQCLYDMPTCDIDNFDSNLIHIRLAGHAPVERAVAGFYYIRDNRFTRLIQAAKYDGRPRIAAWLARRMASGLLDKGFFNGIDTIVPVPLHFSKKWRRGYNQSDYIADAISEATAIPVSHALICRRSHSTQTRRNAFDRWQNARDIYSVDGDAPLANRHILLVDDVITTGATLLSCCDAIHRAAPSVRLSVLALAITQMQ